MSVDHVHAEDAANRSPRFIVGCGSTAFMNDPVDAFTKDADAAGGCTDSVVGV